MLKDKPEQSSSSVSTAAEERLSSIVLTSFALRVFAAVGLPIADAKAVADLMIEADLVGADAHGIFRLPQYVRRLRAGGVNPRPQITVDRTGPATALVDGDNGMGHLVMARAAKTAIEIARETGVAWVGARRSNHAGPGSLYAAMPVAEGMVGIYSAVASANHMAVWGGTEPVLGTNPLAVGIPSGSEPPVLLDIATTIVSYGTIKNSAMHGRQIPEGWMIDRTTGAPLTDAEKIPDGLLLPIGEHKGSGLALVLGLLAGTLNQASFGRDVIDFNADQSSETNTGHFIVALDVSRFLDPEVFASEVDRHRRELRTSARLPTTESIRLPGDDRVRRLRERNRDGVPMTQALISTLDMLGLELGVGELR